MPKEVKSSYRKFPSTKVSGDIIRGWSEILEEVNKKGPVVAIDSYTGVNLKEIEAVFSDGYTIINTVSLFKSAKEIELLTARFLTDNALFGYISYLKLENFFDSEKLEVAKQSILKAIDKPFVIMGPGAFLVAPEANLKIYADLARWEIQKRMKKGEIDGLGVINHFEPYNLQYKRGFFVDWRVCDKHKKQFFLESDFVLETNVSDDPKLVEINLIKNALNKIAHQPFSFVPYFDPGPWGGHWLEKVCNLETENVPNYAWCMNCVAEENSILLDFDNATVELPGNDLVFFESKNLLGDAVEGHFGKEFPIRFDFLDTMDGGNLSLQVHPDVNYIQENFGMHYTQDESYYIIDTKEDAFVYLGLKENVDSGKMFEQLKDARDNGGVFDADEFVNKFPAKQHDHFLIPSGTIHCSGKDSLVLEISSTPFIFTFKMWDWGRLGLDGKPRPINIEHAQNVLDYRRDTNYVLNELINNIEIVASGQGWVEERTGLHKREFIETRRHWFTERVFHSNNGSVNVLMLVEGSKAIIESPHNQFEPFVINFAEAIVIPASVDGYTVSPYEESIGNKIATIKAYVRL